MSPLGPQLSRVLKRPGAFVLQVIKAFNANQGLLLAGAVAYYALLSIVPLLLLMVVALSHVIDQAALLETLRRALEHVVPGQGAAVTRELAAFLEYRGVIGWTLLVTMVFFSTLAFRVLENAMSVIFLHRVAERGRSFWVSALLPFPYMLCIGIGFFIGTLTLAEVVEFGEASLVILGHSWSLDRFSRFLLYLAGLGAEILVVSSIYYFMPAVRISPRHALIGGLTASLLWEIIRHGLTWYFSSLSQNLVYGSLTTAIVVLLTLEIAATLLLLGAQVIAEYERFGLDDGDTPPPVMHEEAEKPRREGHEGHEGTEKPHHEGHEGRKGIGRSIWDALSGT
jgi:membrane protein